MEEVIHSEESRRVVDCGEWFEVYDGPVGFALPKGAAKRMALAILRRVVAPEECECRGLGVVLHQVNVPCACAASTQQKAAVATSPSKPLLDGGGS